MTWYVFGNNPVHCLCDEFTFTPHAQTYLALSRDSCRHLLHSFEADSYDDAMRRYYQWQGWEPYRPLPAGTADDRVG